MGSIYRACCGECGFESDCFTDGYGAVLVDDEPRSPEIGEDGYEPFVGRFLVFLSHPLEMTIQSATGYSDWKLFLEGRYVRVDQGVCPDCGHLVRHRHLDAMSNFGCWLGLVLGVVAGGTLGIVQSSWVWGLVTAWLIATVAWSVVPPLASAWVRMRFPDRAKEIRSGNRCDNCRGTRLLSGTTRRPLVCPSCREMALEVDMVGIS